MYLQQNNGRTSRQYYARFDDKDELMMPNSFFDSSFLISGKGISKIMPRCCAVYFLDLVWMHMYVLARSVFWSRQLQWVPSHTCGFVQFLPMVKLRFGSPLLLKGCFHYHRCMIISILISSVRYAHGEPAQHLYRTIGSLFNHQSFYANCQPT